MNARKLVGMLGGVGALAAMPAAAYAMTFAPPTPTHFMTFIWGGLAVLLFSGGIFLLLEQKAYKRELADHVELSSGFHREPSRNAMKTANESSTARSNNSDDRVVQAA